MKLLIVILLFVLAYFIAAHINFLISCRKLYKLINKLGDLKIFFSMYCNRKNILEQKHLSYDTIFSYNYECDKFRFKSKMSQKQFIADLYEEIRIIDNLIKDLPNGILEKQIDTFYDLRRQIRTEKLTYENTTF